MRKGQKFHSTGPIFWSTNQSDLNYIPRKLCTVLLLFSSVIYVIKITFLITFSLPHRVFLHKAAKRSILSLIVLPLLPGSP